MLTSRIVDDISLVSFLYILPPRNSTWVLLSKFRSVLSCEARLRPHATSELGGVSSSKGGIQRESGGEDLRHRPCREWIDVPQASVWHHIRLYWECRDIL